MKCGAEAGRRTGRAAEEGTQATAGGRTERTNGQEEAGRATGQDGRRAGGQASGRALHGQDLRPTSDQSIFAMDDPFFFVGSVCSSGYILAVSN